MSTFIIDIDGTICDAPQKPDGSYDYPNAVPITETIERINYLYEEGHTIILFTARGNRTFKGDLQKIEEFHGPILKDWMDRHGVKRHEIRTGKPWGNDPIYIDNRNLSLKAFVWKHPDQFENIIKEENSI
jgi:capsule biosynthesis phosphatase